MLKKITAIILLAALCLSMCACNNKSAYKTSWRPYINESPASGMSDGITYVTEEGQTDNFIAYKEDGRVMLYPLNEKKFTPYSPEGLCKVKPGKAYTITYDAQLIQGGINGMDERFFLTVYDCKECSYDTLFENGYYFLTWKREFPIGGEIEGTSFMAFKGNFGGYDVFSEKNGKVHYSEMREVKFPLSTGGQEVEMQFNVFCNKSVSDDHIIDQMLGRKYDNDPKFVFINCHHKDYDAASDNDYDSVERLATGSKYYRNTYHYIADEIPSDGKIFIPYEDINSVTAEDLGIDKELFDCIYMGWSDRNNGYYSDYNADGGQAKKCDVLIFTGNFNQDAVITYDKDFMLDVAGKVTDDADAGEDTFQYFVLFVNTDFCDLFSQV